MNNIILILLILIGIFAYLAFGQDTPKPKFQITPQLREYTPQRFSM